MTPARSGGLECALRPPGWRASGARSGPAQPRGAPRRFAALHQRSRSASCLRLQPVRTVRDDGARGGGAAGEEARRRAARTLTRGAAQPIAATRAAFLARLDGVIVGPDPANGIFIDNVFQQPALAVALEMPPGWKMKNTPAAAVASEPEGRAVVTLQIAGEGRDPAEGARQDGLDERLVDNSRVGPLPAFQRRS